MKIFAESRQKSVTVAGLNVFLSASSVMTWRYVRYEFRSASRAFLANVVADLFLSNGNYDIGNIVL